MNCKPQKKKFLVYISWALILLPEIKKVQHNEEQIKKLWLNISFCVLRKNIKILRENFKFFIWKKIMCIVLEGKWRLVIKGDFKIFFISFFFFYFQGLQEAWMLEARIKKRIWEKVHLISIEQPMGPSQTHPRILRTRTSDRDTKPLRIIFEKLWQ